MSKLRVFEVLDNGYLTWFCAHNKSQAVKMYNAWVTEIVITKDDVFEIPETEWGHFTITDPDTEVIEKTFKEYMKSATEPDFIATTCY